MILQGFGVPRFPKDLSPRHMHVCLAAHNKGLFNTHPDEYSLQFYHVVHDDLFGTDEVVFLPRISATDVLGQTVKGRVVHAQHGEAGLDDLVVVEVQ